MLKKIILDKKWNKHKKGSTVEVDPVRAKWLKDNGFDAGVKAETKKKRK